MLAGVSSLDTMFIDLDLDPAYDGLQMYEATDLLVKQRPLQPDVPCLLWQVGAVRVGALLDRSEQSRGRFGPNRGFCASGSTRPIMS